jgi:hypothetical protein
MTIAPPLPSASPAQSAGIGVPGGPAAHDEASLRLYGLVRDIRVEAQHLSRLLEPVRAAVKATGAETQATALAAGLRDVHRVFRVSRAEVDARLEEIHLLLAENPAIYNDVGDSIADLENQWLEMAHALTWTDAPDVAGVVPRLATFDARLPDLEWQAAIVTVPIRVVQHLATKRIGGRVNFHEAFKDEVESRDLRVELLRYLREHAASLDCVVDVPNGMLYRVAPGVGRRAWSWILVLGLATVGGYGFVLLLTQGLPAFGLPSGTINGLRADRFTELLGAWWGLVLGAFAHLVVDAIKQEQTADSGAFTALEDWFVWIHVREYALVVTVVSLGAILVGLAALMPDAGSIAFVTALGAGYSSDSVLGLFITRFQATASAASEVVTDRLKTPAPGA